MSSAANLHVVRRLLELAPALLGKRNSYGITPLRQVEFFIGNPDALEGLARRLAQNGKSCASKQELVCIVEQLEKTAPLPVIHKKTCQAGRSRVMGSSSCFPIQLK